jgi:8-oxo-dGTP pyrophosphatase MutT (NUDIX family)
VTFREIDLRSQLLGYQARDERERGHLMRMTGLCNSVADPFSRQSFAPGHFTASAFILSPDRSELLLILHAKLGRWLQPGGHVDPADADMVSAALREVREEVGLVQLELLTPGPFDLDVHDIPARREEAGHQHFDVRYLFRALTREVTAGSDAKAARWVPLAEIDDQLSDASVQRVVAKLQSLS